VRRVKGPADYFYYADTVYRGGGSHRGKQYFAWWLLDNVTNNSGMAGALPMQARHNEKVTVWFVDGHVASHYGNELARKADLPSGYTSTVHIADKTLTVITFD
jgi:prepilin-type processing-associated H-X9-DG protein